MRALAATQNDAADERVWMWYAAWYHQHHRAHDANQYWMRWCGAKRVGAVVRMQLLVLVRRETRNAVHKRSIITLKPTLHYTDKTQNTTHTVILDETARAQNTTHMRIPDHTT